MLDVVLCCSEKSVLTALKNFRSYQGHGLRFKSLQGDDGLIIKYLVTKVNEKSMPEKSKRRFTIQTARLFVENFNCNLIELESYCKSKLKLVDFIHERRHAKIKELEKYSENLPAGVSLRFERFNL
jgi:hypothetical protein